MYQAKPEDLERRLLQVDHLLKSDAWALIKEKMKEAQTDQYNKMVGSSSAHDSAKFLGAYHAISQLLAWPERERFFLSETLKTVDRP